MLKTDELTQAILTAFNKQSSNKDGKTDDPAKARKEMAEDLANAIEAFVKSGTVTVDEGILLMAGSYSGSTTSTGTGSIS